MLSRYDKNTTSKENMEETQVVSMDEIIFSIMQDHEVNIWFGASGLYKYDGGEVTSFKKKELTIY